MLERQHVFGMIQGMPLLYPDAALFLDIDGTLAALERRPEEVCILPSVKHSLWCWKSALQGAVALISGRTIEAVDALFAPFVFAAAGQHGLEIRDAEGNVTRADIPEKVMQEMSSLIRLFHQKYPLLHVEYKGLSIAIHYRQAPVLEETVKAYLRQIITPYHAALSIQEGKQVAELRCAGADKGQAIEQLMTSPIFAGRTPFFLGDDQTDEHGFAAVNRLGGISIKVGDGSTCAAYRCMDVREVHGWLARIFRRDHEIFGTGDD